MAKKLKLFKVSSDVASRWEFHGMGSNPLDLLAGREERINRRGVGVGSIFFILAAVVSVAVLIFIFIRSV